MRFRFPARWQDGEHGPNPLTEAVNARKAAGLPLLDLTVSNPTAVGLAFPGDWPQLLQGEGSTGTSREGERSALHVYNPDPKGLPVARRAIAEYRDGDSSAVLPPVSPDDLFLVSGTSEGYAHLFRLLCEPGDAILVPRPSYPLLDALAGINGITIASYPLVAETRPTQDAVAWRIDRDALEAEAGEAGPRARAIVVVSPNNPTGHALADDDGAWLLAFAEARGLAVIVDEVFADYRHDGQTTARLVPAADGPLVFTLNGLSKLVGLPQLKLAWIHVAGNAADKAVAAEALEWMCDAHLSVGTAPQLACAPLLRRRAEFQDPIRARLAKNLATLRAIADGAPGLQVLWPQGGWCVPVHCAGIGDDERFAIRLVEEAGVLVQPGYFFEFDDEETVVASLLVPEEVFREGMERLAAHVSGAR